MAGGMLSSLGAPGCRKVWEMTASSARGPGMPPPPESPWPRCSVDVVHLADLAAAAACGGDGMNCGGHLLRAEQAVSALMSSVMRVRVSRAGEAC